MGWDEDTDKVIWGIEFKLKREALHELKQENVFHGLEDAYDLFDRLEVLWAYAADQVDGGTDDLPDGWLWCVVPNEIQTVRAGLHIRTSWLFNGRLLRV